MKLKGLTFFSIFIFMSACACATANSNANAAPVTPKTVATTTTLVATPDESANTVVSIEEPAIYSEAVVLVEEALTPNGEAIEIVEIVAVNDIATDNEAMAEPAVETETVTPAVDTTPTVDVTAPVVDITSAIKLDKRCEEIFYVRKSSNENVLYYDVNMKNGAIDSANPINIYWIMHATDGHKEDMSFLESSQLGVTTKEIIKGQKYIVNLKHSDLKNKTITVSLDAGCAVATIPINGSDSYMVDVFVQLESGWSLIPGIEYIDINGLSPINGKTVTERLEQ